MPPSGGSTAQSTSGLPNARLRQQIAALVSTAWQLVFLGNQIAALTGNQLASVAPLGPGLRTLIARLESLTAADPTASALLAQLQQLSALPPTAASAVKRIVLLHRLLAYLSRTDPLAAKRLAPALPALNALVMGLLRAQTNGTLAGALLSGSYQLSITGNPINMLGANVPVLEPVPIEAFSGATNSVAADHGLAGRFEQAGGSVTHERAGAAMHVPPPAMAPIPPAPAPLSGGGAAASAGGGIGSAGPAMALLAALVVWALNFFSGRVDLDLAPWRMTLLASRLERPG